MKEDDPGALLDGLQRNAFAYFVREADAGTGLIRDKTAGGDWPASIAAVGMALAGYPVGVERGFIDRAEAAERTLRVLRFFAASEQSRSAEATGYRGFYFHFLHMQSGRRAWRCELSSIDTALLIAGMLTAGAYFDAEAAEEAEIRALATALHERVDWAWMLGRQETLCHGWRPGGRGAGFFLRRRWRGYDESMLMQVLALGSPTHRVAPSCYAAWARGHAMKSLYGIPHLPAGPLFIHQLSQVWLDLRGVRDRFMREHDSDYFENSRRATLVQQRHAMANPLVLAHGGEHCWGVSASDGPGPARRTVAGVRHAFFGYAARGVPHGPDDGTLAPSVALASLPFAPEVVLPTIVAYRRLLGARLCAEGLPAAVNPRFPANDGNGFGWVSPYRFGIDEGPALLMIENHRSGLIWDLMRGAAPIVAGLRRAGFEGGWLG